ncbi:hypothetical protein MBLNU459_g2908t1 [Dothideomycetes sp. NU459]
MHWLAYSSLPLVLAIFWIYTSMLTSSFPSLQNKRILLLIAHPDDEAMFFAPVLQLLTRPALGNHVKILCLSSGDADGLGAVRRKELVKSGAQLGLRSAAADVLVLDDARFPDSMAAAWDAKAIAALLAGTFAPKMAAMPARSAPEAGIDVLVTFDGAGVSGHPNHVSLYHGAVAFVRAIMARHAGWEAPVKVYTLTSVNVVRKYMSVLDAPVTMLREMVVRKEAGAFPSPLLVVSGLGDYRNAQRAMTSAHVSQMRWFRWGWIGISRYMVINDLRKEKISV